jgi:hypothetical protein
MFNLLKTFMLSFIRNLFKRRVKNGPILEDLPKMGLLTREEVLKIKKDRAIDDWKSEVKFNRKKK